MVYNELNVHMLINFLFFMQVTLIKNKLAHTEMLDFYTDPVTSYGTNNVVKNAHMIFASEL